MTGLSNSVFNQKWPRTKLTEYAFQFDWWISLSDRRAYHINFPCWIARTENFSVFSVQYLFFEYCSSHDAHRISLWPEIASRESSIRRHKRATRFAFQALATAPPHFCCILLHATAARRSEGERAQVLSTTSFVANHRLSGLASPERFALVRKNRYSINRSFQFPVFVFVNFIFFARQSPLALRASFFFNKFQSNFPRSQKRKPVLGGILD